MFIASPFRHNSPYSEAGQRETQAYSPMLLFDLLLYDLHHLLPEQDESVINDFVVVVVFE